MDKTAFVSPIRGLPFDANVKYLARQGKNTAKTVVGRAQSLPERPEKEKEAGIGSALRSGGAKLMSAGRRLAAPPAPKIGRFSAIGGGAAIGAVGGAAHGAMNKQPGQTTMQAMGQGAKAGATLGAVGGVGYRHMGNKMLKARHARQIARL